jgi:7-keto-8-aminopelargonate synthetase-like enzyme
MHTLEQNYCNVLIRKLLHVSVLTGASSGSAQLYTTAHPNLLSYPYVELSQIRQYVIIIMDMCTDNYKIFKLQKL